ncbi:hypothetical protein ID866_8487 [Astraeus odoratus]|nr:hypothetical protein ID866_8487 [Astraeus odoratus]
MLSQIALLALFIPKTLAGVSPNSSGCLCTYGDPCWPTADQFAELELQVSQPLVYPIPTASLCYPIGNPSGNCSEVIINWTNGNWRSSFPGSMEAPNFESFMFKNGTINACYLNTTLGIPCEQGNVPAIGVDARSPEDIQAAVKFALQYNLKLVIKNTGHDFLGRSAKRGAFLVWTHNMKNITYDSGFVPEGAPINETYEALTIGAGVQWYEAYAAANNSGRSLVGGVSLGGSVGAAGGWLQGGGHSALSPSYGLGVDNAIEITVVTSAGEHLTVNNYQYSDLFWALRGGGGGTYGIVTSVTYRTYPSLPIAFYVMEANVTGSADMSELLGGVLQFQPNLTDAGWGGYGAISNNTTYLAVLAPNMSTEVANATTQPLTDLVLSLQPQGVSPYIQIFQFPSFYDWFEYFFGSPGQNGANVMITSRLLSRDTISKQYQDVVEILIDCQATFNMVAGGKVSQFDSNSAGLNPAWRNAIVEVVCGVSWEEGATAQEIGVQIDQLKAWIDAFHNIAPNDGAYFNEASLFEIDWKETFFGSHYSTLKQIKDKYDPYRLFVVAEGVGSEEWNKELTCRR